MTSGRARSESAPDGDRASDLVWPRDVWLDALWDAEGLKPNERVVAYAYARYAGRRDVSWCSWDELRRRTGIRSRDAISRALAGLIGAGWLTEVSKARQHYSARYRLTIPCESEAGDVA